MARQQPIVRNGHLFLPGEGMPLAVGQDAWYSWLAGAQSFRYEGEQGSFGARRERFQRGGWYWRAYRRVGGRLRRVYLGRPGDLTTERLALVAAELDNMPLAGQATQAVTEPAGEPALLLETKLRPPAIRRGALERPALRQLLDHALAHRLTVITAPAGYGKTTLLAQWCHSLEAGVAWLSLDDDDNDAARLWQYVVASL
ncbi:MAG TPA: hypothetical protein VFT99_01915, partial [Roseiflexaceae bacterium]|nr:hypothetical protein [Roseiflexaceae bacterium]